MFLGPASDYEVEAWQVFLTFDLERQDDNTVKVVHPDADYWKRQEDYETLYQSKVEWTPAQFTTAIAAADTARRAEFDGRSGSDPRDPMLVTNAANLRDIHVETGNVNHPDGPPAPPPRRAVWLYRTTSTTPVSCGTASRCWRRRTRCGARAR